MVPEGWKLDYPTELVSFFSGFAFKSTDSVDAGVRWLKIANVGIGEVKWDDESYLPQHFQECYHRFYLQVGDIVVAMTRPTLGNHLKVAKIKDKDDEALLNQRVAKLVIKKGNDSEFVYQVFRTESIAARINSALLGTDPPNLSVSVLRDFTIPIPPLPEQKKIAQILSTWDQAITATERLLENSQQRKKGLMQQLLTGKKRLLGFEGEWEQVPLGSIFERVTTRNEGQSTNVVTISGQQGLIRQQEFFKKSVASETLDNYFLLKKGQFAYNKSYSNGYPMGAIKRLNRYDDGVVTTLYICFELADEHAANSDFYEQYFESGLLNQGLMQVAHEGGRAHGLLNVKPSDFFSLMLQKPDIDEQKAIANVLCIADSEIDAQKARLEQLRSEKRALMQQLLTGKRRVQVETEAA
ncbi:restriction endonuclease subunit S [Marinobacter sp. ST-43]|uniref:restriction endonuclease subunit S n=1 Tax=Marinobacter sp. ST-43 TaxID=3050453 RepID=UPI0026E03D4E|nr:restriction endonuclease subunit S [Marinobacter sp. ST-43]